jgi:UDP-N-acetyl-D-mannosaminuronic acid dehydrogenase
VNIAFANELSIVCDKLDINVWELIKLANRHPRVNILQPGPGVGGHCIAVDPWFIVSQSPDEARLIRSAREVNDSKPNWVIEKVKDALTAHLLANPTTCVRDITIACFGLAFKQNIDDLRESPAVSITNTLAKLNTAQIWAVEPNIALAPKSLHESVVLKDVETACNDADIILILVDHREFLEIKWNQIKCQTIVDTKGVLMRPFI